MHLLSISLYEFGQFLQITLWIFVPAVVVALLVTTYLHYRGRRKLKEQAMMDYLAVSASSSYEVHSSSYEVHLISGTGSEGDAAPMEKAPGFTGSSGDEPAEGHGNMYQAMLWMKEKYEQFREESDERYALLQEDLVRTEKKYLALVEAGPGVTTDLAGIVEDQDPTEAVVGELSPEADEFEPELRPQAAKLRIAATRARAEADELGLEIAELRRQNEFLNGLAEEKSRQIDSLNRLLMTIYQQLDQSMRDEIEMGSIRESAPVLGKG